MTVNSLEEAREVQYSPVTGIIRHAVLHFPPGCNSLVEIFIHRRTEQILPEGRVGIALDDATQLFEINEPVIKGDPIRVIARNHDDTYPHTVTAIIYIEKTTLEGIRPIEVI